MPNTANRYDDPNHTHEHGHGALVHSHPHAHREGIRHDDPKAHEHDHDDQKDHEHGEHAHHGTAHGHSHGLVDRSIVRSREGIRTVVISLVVLGLTAAI